MPIKKTKIILEQRLATGFPSLSIAYPNVSFTPPDSLYLRCQMVVKKPEDPVRGSAYRRENIDFQVFVVAPYNKGEGEALDIASQVAELFKRGTSISGTGIIVQVFESPQIGGSGIAGNRLIIPVITNVVTQVFN